MTASSAGASIPRAHSAARNAHHRYRNAIPNQNPLANLSTEHKHGRVESPPTKTFAGMEDVDGGFPILPDLVGEGVGMETASGHSTASGGQPTATASREAQCNSAIGTMQAFAKQN